MTHDELLKKINRIVNLVQEAVEIEATPAWIETYSMLSALHAVVELHKQGRCKQDCCDVCVHCHNLAGEHADVWPCPTIQAIEKELNANNQG